MSKLKEVIAYILINYPHKDELSNARLTKMVYLADWKLAIERKKQITTINWYFDNYGPYVPDVQQEVQNNTELFECRETINMFGSPKRLFSIKDSDYAPALSADEAQAIDHVITETKVLNWDDFINLVYSTHPISSSSRYSNINLVQKAKEYAR
jgi:uncharacterized protein YwgA